MTSRSEGDVVVEGRLQIVLPRALVDIPTTGAKMDDGILRITFEGRSGARRK